MENGPQPAVEMEEVRAPIGGLRPNPFGLHANEQGDVRIFIQDREGVFDDGVVNIIGDPKGTLSSSARLPFGSLVEKLITQYLFDTLKIYIRLLKDLVQHRQKGVANTVKSALHLPLTLGFSVLGGLLPTSFIAPALGTNLQATINSILPFLPQDFAFGIGVFISVSICTNWGNKLSDKVLLYIFNHILDSPDPLLNFSDHEIEQILQDGGQQVSQDLIDEFKNAISFLQGMATKEQSAYQDFASLRNDRNITRVAEKLREGNFRPLIRYAEGVKSKNLVSLSSANRNTDGGRDQKREAEMFFAERVLQAFRNRL